MPASFDVYLLTKTLTIADIREAALDALDANLIDDVKLLELADDLAESAQIILAEIKARHEANKD